LSFFTTIDMPLNSSRDPKVGPRAKQMKKKSVGACSLIHSILGVGGRVRALGWDYDEFTSESSKWGQFAQPRKEGS
jgi:hypothetical protein